MDYDISQQSLVIETAVLDQLLAVLRQQGFQIVGPTVQNGAIVYDHIASIADLPVGMADQQSAAVYRLQPRADDAMFGFAVGPHSWKRFLYPPLQSLWQACNPDGLLDITPAAEETPTYAFIGVRACELHAIAIQDHVFMHNAFADLDYVARRQSAFIVAINCAQAGGTCFCASMQTGPKVTQHFDLALTEVLHDNQHYFVVEVGSPQGQGIIDRIPRRAARAEERAAAAQVIANTAQQMGRSLDTTDIQSMLYSRQEHPRWDDVARRCLSCANCTMVCPTCFCSSIDDVTSLDGATAERQRRWDSCFNVEFSYLHGGSIRSTTRSRYRQWLTHKLASWIDQFGTSGCVGCGRCITWCPAGIDITEEVSALRQPPSGAIS
jgi:sulfhydrogenase subunit beta (sulfur reductase)